MEIQLAQEIRKVEAKISELKFIRWRSTAGCNKFEPVQTLDTALYLLII
jgi:hypothetical protein